MYRSLAYCLNCKRNASKTTRYSLACLHKSRLPLAMGVSRLGGCFAATTYVSTGLQKGTYLQLGDETDSVLI